MFLTIFQCGIDTHASNGPLQIAYVADDEPYTDYSFVWSKYVA